jgi:hypothetical protein
MAKQAARLSRGKAHDAVVQRTAAADDDSASLNPKRGHARSAATRAARGNKNLSQSKPRARLVERHTMRQCSERLRQMIRARRWSRKTTTCAARGTNPWQG